MLPTDNMKVSIDPTNLAYEPPFYFIPSNYFSTLPSTSQSDLFGFHCNNNFDSSKQFSFRRRYPHHPKVDVASYPSPPPTASNPKRSVSLPSLSTGSESLTGTDSKPRSFGGILDSPLVENHISTNNLALISPPASVRTPTLPLPSNDDDFASDETLKDDQQALLSPLSPEWTSSAIEDLHHTSGPDGIVLLSSSHDASHDFYSQTHEDPLEDLWTPQSSEVELTDTSENIRPRFSEPPTYDAEEPISFLPRFPHPSSPSIYSSSMDISEPPDSPSWSPSSLPELEMDDGDSDSDTLLTPPSPSSKSLSLPGAECEYDLFDSHMAWSGSEPDLLQTAEETSLSSLSISPRRNQGLLLIDDANDFPTPRSPSPDNFDLHPSVYANCSDPDVAKLVALRRKSQLAERFAKEVEERSLSQGSMFVRADARKKRKKEKERVKEITAMLRLKLETNLPSNEEAGDVGNEGHRCHCPSPEVKRARAKKAISSIPQLVARMTFRRRDGSDRPITHMPAPPKPKPLSNLRKSWGADDEDSDEDDSDDYMGLDDSIMALKGFDDFSSPPTSPATTDSSSDSGWPMMIDEDCEGFSEK
ncbi:hypothetical protein E1B28_002315 [Marasmius oreades]|uniref:Uncharacterized protein n=1 Tax=Marasmius oreades TaxID=181124 RepID=A0A9P7RMS8_9AGAR|nr:uncharacterized protein E1B28_002315 [Marasmius oreades]KAG7086355.1 hypothetical protein E1B28_002315 [Marasmius oreades]